MDCPSSPDSFVSASEGNSGEIEMVDMHVINICTDDISAANPETNTINQANETDDKKELLKWDRTAIVLSFTSMISLLGVSYFSIDDDGKFFPKTFKNSWEYVVFLMVINTAFYFPIYGFILSRKFPDIGKFLSLASLVGISLSFTVLSSTLLPPYFNWVPWFFFVSTLGLVIYTIILHTCKD